MTQQLTAERKSELHAFPFPFPSVVADTPPQPLVSVIVPTKNSAATLDACLQSIKNQKFSDSPRYKKDSPSIPHFIKGGLGGISEFSKILELIIVDNFSTDSTLEIAKKLTDKVFSKGPERSAQRNFGVSHARGIYLYFM